MTVTILIDWCVIVIILVVDPFEGEEDFFRNMNWLDFDFHLTCVLFLKCSACTDLVCNIEKRVIRVKEM